ncbi:sulfatase family protein [Thalassoroseus pseudoceratinae]|uniref:sulfatase family protein n=1 Tax=Thalassoroseus pseudoceratinae TaxID=2713176 RepID=UPI00141F0CF3|nr:sulfatase-like hydrolase/transferase [Thalassoroseus pseudoceratinae]
MHRQRIARTIQLLTCLLLASCPAFAAGQSDGSERPNILFIFTDDWGWGDLGCHGHPYLKTPNIDRLAQEGTDFHRFTVASGVCSPSRTAVMTGHFPARYKIDGHFAWVNSNAKRNVPDWLDPKTPTLPRMLQSAGYATAHFGKWHLSNNMIPDSPLPTNYGYDEYGAFNCAGEQMPVHEDAARAIAFIEKNAAAKKPFFINLWMHEPHTPHHTLPEYRRRFPKLDDPNNVYASVLSHADDRIGELLDALDRLKLTDDTLVIFSSDNGPAGSGRGGKLTVMYDSATGEGFGIGGSVGTTGGRNGRKASILQGGIGVPFIARWPGKIKAGAIDDVSWISAVDLLPTFCEIAGAEMPDGYQPDGTSQLATLQGTKAPRREKPLFWKGVPNRRGPSYSILDGQWRLLTDADFEILELFNVNKDPLEKNNLKDSHPEIAAEMLQKLQAWHRTLPAKPNPECFSKYRARNAGPLPTEAKPLFQFDPSR